MNKGMFRYRFSGRKESNATPNVYYAQSSSGSVPNGLTYVVPLRPGRVFPPIPQGGFQSEDEIAKLRGVRSIESVDVAPGPTPGIYAFTRQTVQRGLYHIPLP